MNEIEVGCRNCHSDYWWYYEIKYDFKNSCLSVFFLMEETSVSVKIQINTTSSYRSIHRSEPQKKKAFWL